MDWVVFFENIYMKHHWLDHKIFTETNSRNPPSSKTSRAMENCPFQVIYRSTFGIFPSYMSLSGTHGYPPANEPFAMEHGLLLDDLPRLTSETRRFSIAMSVLHRENPRLSSQLGPSQRSFDQQLPTSYIVLDFRKIS